MTLAVAVSNAPPLPTATGGPAAGAAGALLLLLPLLVLLLLLLRGVWVGNAGRAGSNTNLNAAARRPCKDS